MPEVSGRNRKLRLLLVGAVVAAGIWYGGRALGWWGEKSGDQLALYGNVEIREVQLGFRVGGRISKILVDEGDKVQPGQILAELDLRPFADRLAGAEARLLAASAAADREENGSVGASYDVAPGWKLGLNLSQAVRAPSAEELFANGPHHGTESFEVGNPDLRKERARSVEAILRGSGDRFDFELSAYHSWFSNFIYDSRTGDFEDGLPVYQINQANARLYGFEAQADLVLARTGGWTFKAEAMVDYVHATINGSGPAPRIPPLRVKGGLHAKSAVFDFGAEVERTTGQNRVAAFETTTPGFTMVNAELVWRPWGNEKNVSLILSGHNLFDVEARRHASVLKDYAPLAGRDIRLSARMEF